ncbi:MAG TPA: trypsin-like serine protease [Candidatus Dojkabacteria bacterium]|jgi:LPXTG-motif cell wall-anchored protein
MKENRIISILIGLVMLISVGLAVFELTTGNLSIIFSDALIGGQEETGYEHAGYIVTADSNGDVFLCGMAYLGKNIGITAAHCVENYSSVYPNTGNYSPSFITTSYTVNNVVLNPAYESGTTDFDENDVAVIEMTGGPDLSSYAQVVSPTVGCSYFLVAYGEDENDGIGIRKGQNVCIDSITGRTFDFTVESGNICSGDSGSGIYEKDTSRLVGLVVARGVSEQTDCTSNEAQIAVRLDSQAEFLENYATIADITPTPTPTTSASITATPSPSPTTAFSLTVTPTPIGGIQVVDNTSPSGVPSNLPNTDIEFESNAVIFLGIALVFGGFALYLVASKRRSES